MNQEQHSEEIKLLRHGLSKISVAANGFDNELDLKLAALRRELRLGSEKNIIQTHVEDISKTIVRVDQEKAEKRSVVVNAIKNIISPMLEMELPDKITRSLSLIQQKLSSSEEVDTVKIINGFSKIMLSIVAMLQEKSKQTGHQKDTSGFWGKIASGDDPNSIKLNESVSRCLLELIEHLRLPKELYEEATKIKERISRHLSVKELEDTVEIVTQLVIEAFNLEQDKMKAFLEQIAGRLEGMQSFLSDSKSYGEETLSNTAELDENIQKEIEQIQQGMQSGITMEQLTEMLGDRLDNISSNISDYREREEVRLKESKQKIEKLEDQLKTSEEETNELKLSLSYQRHRAQHDPLTGLPNREAYNDHLDQAMNRWQRGHGELCLAIADIDHFKNINDTYGHLAGDKVLKKIAKIIRSSLRNVDFVARFGGEEFVILLEKSPLQDAQEVIEKLREKIETTNFHFREQRVVITSSFGVAGFRENESPDDVFARADKALYDAKETGRNKVSVAE